MLGRLCHVWIAVSLAVCFAAGCGDDDSSDEDDGGTDTDTDADADAGCGSLAEGDTDISGSLILDGYFAALLELRTQVDGLSTEFETALDEQLVIWGIEGGPEMVLEDKVAALKSEILANLAACISGSLQVGFGEPTCASSIVAAWPALYDCEAQTGCEVVSPMPEDVDVFCEGVCSGACGGDCTGACGEESFVGACAGQCDGSCTLAGTIACNGACAGDCLGVCHGVSDGAICDGTCCGDCDGACENAAPAGCAGTCTGTCATESSGPCEGLCEGDCEGVCGGGCQGDAIPPSASPYGACEVTAYCQPQAVCWGRALVECGPAVVNLCYDFNAGVDAGARAEFEAKIEPFRAWVQNAEAQYYELRDLLEGVPVSGVEAGLVRFQTVLETLSAEFGAGSYDEWIDEAHRPCVPPALVEAQAILDSIAADATATLEAQRTLFDVLNLD